MELELWCARLRRVLRCARLSRVLQPSWRHSKTVHFKNIVSVNKWIASLFSTMHQHVFMLLMCSWELHVLTHFNVLKVTLLVCAMHDS